MQHDFVRLADQLSTFTRLDWDRLRDAVDRPGDYGHGTLSARLERLQNRVKALPPKTGAIGATITTRSGITFDYLNPTPEMIDLGDIAYGLAREGRYANQLPGSLVWSVLRHSRLVASVVDRPLKFQARMHDAVEAYVRDMPSPMKRIMPEYNEIEDIIWRRAVAPKFGLPQKLDDAVKHADLRALHTEKVVFNMDPGRDWGLGAYPLINDHPLTYFFDEISIDDAACTFIKEVSDDIRARGLKQDDPNRFAPNEDTM